VKTFLLISLAELTIVLFPFCGQAQQTCAPLFVFTNGSGSITPLQNGQLLQVGQSYGMTAIPNSGYVFNSWQPIDISIATLFAEEADGNLVAVATNVIPLPQPQYYTQPALDFVMQPQVTILSNSLVTIIDTTGWQANFEPVFNLQITSETNGQCALILSGPSGLNYSIEMATALSV
jgi:hypothetical protein